MERDGITEEERPKVVNVDSADEYEGDKGSSKLKKFDSFDIETVRFKSDHGHSSNQVCVFPLYWKRKKKE